MDGLRKNGNASMPEQVKRTNPWRKMMMMMMMMMVVVVVVVMMMMVCFACIGVSSLVGRRIW